MFGQSTLLVQADTVGDVRIWSSGRSERYPGLSTQRLMDTCAERLRRRTEEDLGASAFLLLLLVSQVLYESYDITRHYTPLSLRTDSFAHVYDMQKETSCKKSSSMATS